MRSLPTLICFRDVAAFIFILINLVVYLFINLFLWSDGGDGIFRAMLDQPSGVYLATKGFSHSFCMQILLIYLVKPKWIVNIWLWLGCNVIWFFLVLFVWIEFQQKCGIILWSFKRIEKWVIRIWKCRTYCADRRYSMGQQVIIPEILKRDYRRSDGNKNGVWSSDKSSTFRWLRQIPLRLKQINSLLSIFPNCLYVDKNTLNQYHKVGCWYAP